MVILHEAVTGVLGTDELPDNWLSQYINKIKDTGLYKVKQYESVLPAEYHVKVRDRVYIWE